jgi:hypothetical protein
MCEDIPPPPLKQLYTAKDAPNKKEQDREVDDNTKIPKGRTAKDLANRTKHHPLKEDGKTAERRELKNNPKDHSVCTGPLVTIFP